MDNSLAINHFGLLYHIIGITILAVTFVIMGAGIRVGGFALT